MLLFQRAAVAALAALPAAIVATVALAADSVAIEARDIVCQRMSSNRLHFDDMSSQPRILDEIDLIIGCFS
jgi:hypothetical protein